VPQAVHFKPPAEPALAAVLGKPMRATIN
jgi:hypothetical protein